MSVEKLLSRYPAEVRELARGAAVWLRKVIPDATESADESGNLIGYSIGHGYKGLVCTLLLSKTGVKLGLSGGASLPDPEQLLEGSGRKHKYVQLRTLSDVNREGVRALVEETVRRTRAGHE